MGQLESDLPDPALVVLVGPSGSGKSTWAAEHFRPEEIVSSDRLRAIVGSGESDLDASDAAFELLDQIVAHRLGRRLTVVVDTLGFDQERRQLHLDLARSHGVPTVLVRFDTPADLSRERNRSRTRPVPASVLTQQIKRYSGLHPLLDAEAWDQYLRIQDDSREEGTPRPARPASSPVATGLKLYLHISRFPGEPIGPWLGEMAKAAEQTGFFGVSVMDHLIQIPQVGRPWENMLEPYSALSFMAAVTTRLELGSLVTAANLRNPGLLAKTVATLEGLSGGRAFCGLGAGWFDAELKAYGYPKLTARERVDILEDAIGILRAMWAPGLASYQGIVNSVNDAAAYPRPLHPIPIIVGGKRPRMVRLACRLADGLNLVDQRSLHLVETQVREVKERRPFQLSVLDLPLLAPSRNAVAEMVERHRGRVRAEEFGPQHSAGMAPTHIERMRLLIQQGVDAVFVSPVGLAQPEEVEWWRPVVEGLS